VNREAPASHDKAALLLRRCSDEGLRVCPVGGATKLGWGAPGEPVDVELSTAGIAEIVEHNVGDLTAVLDAGAPLGAAQAAFAEAGQMLALDPPLGGAGGAATIGGIVASGDSGPLRHRYGAARDLVVGMTMALADGTVARAGGKVIKNVAGYDLAKLLAGSFGTLGLILQVAVRLHPLASTRVTLRVEAASAAEVTNVVAALAHAHLEMESLDVNWSDGSGAVLARFGGAAAHQQATAAAERAGGGELVEDDAALWEQQRELQRADGGVVVRVSGLQTELARVVEEAERAGATLVGRAALGISWLALDVEDDDAAVAAIGDLRARLSPRPCVLLDAPAAVREALDVWDERDPGRIALARRVKERFDPGRTMRPGVFVGGI
jgi:glycolate oxidase FAD binding subunit